MQLRKEFLSNCRFCLGRLVPFDQTEIDQDITDQFFEVTNVNVNKKIIQDPEVQKINNFLFLVDTI